MLEGIKSIGKDAHPDWSGLRFSGLVFIVSGPMQRPWGFIHLEIHSRLSEAIYGSVQVASAGPLKTPPFTQRSEVDFLSLNEKDVAQALLPAAIRGQTDVGTSRP